MSYGLGSIETRNGLSRLRVSVNGKRKTLAKGTVEQCESVQRGWAKLRACGEASTASSPSLQSWGPTWLDRRELSGLRDSKNERSRWKHIEAASFYAWPMADVQRADVRAWLDEMSRKKPGARHKAKRLSAGTVRHARKLLNGCFASALEEGIITRNPVDGLRVARRPDEAHAWTWLPPAEQSRLLSACPEPERWLMQVALGTGVRQSELYRLPLTDVHMEEDAPHIVVRFSRKGRTTKNGKVRRVPLFGMALEGMREWLSALPRYAPKNPFGLVFPTARGCRRGESKPPRGWREWLKAAGLDIPQKRHDGRAIRFHDLRHTCASSLVAGWWGKAWALDRVRDLLGHSSVTVTERYAHLAASVLDDEARSTSGLPASAPNIAPGLAPHAPLRLVNPARHARFEPATFGSGEPLEAEELSAVAEGGGSLGAEAEQLQVLAARQLRAVAGRSRFVSRYSVQLAEQAHRVAVALQELATSTGRPSARQVG